MSEIRPISYSFLQKLELGPQYINVREEEQDYFVIGSLVDALLTEPDKIDEKFCFYLDEKISPSVKKIVDRLFLRKKNLTEADILEVAKDMKYGDGWKPETVIRKVKEDGEAYLKFLDECRKKTVVTRMYYDIAHKVVASLKDDPFTREELKSYYKDVEVLTQMRIDWNYSNIPATSRLDYLFIDHKNKKLIPKDLKTTGSPVYEFPKSYINWGYYTQAAFYTEAVGYWKSQRSEFKYYTIEPFKFIVESTKIVGSPMVFECSAHDLYCGKWGGKIRGGKTSKGFDKLVSEYKWYLEKDYWSHSKEYIENNGKIYLNAFEET